MRDRLQLIIDEQLRAHHNKTCRESMKNNYIISNILPTISIKECCWTIEKTLMRITMNQILWSAMQIPLFVSFQHGRGNPTIQAE